MKMYIAFFVAFTYSALLPAQYDYEPSERNPFGLPNPEAPAEIKDFQPMIGLCDCMSSTRNQDGAWAEPIPMTWQFNYIMNGLAVQDHTLKSDGGHSGSIRQFIPDSSSWYVHYYSSSKPSSKLGTWKGGKQGNEILLYQRQKAPNGAEGNYKITFYDISATGYKWLGEWISPDESVIYPTWKIDCTKRT